jgi:hypothetical protein
MPFDPREFEPAPSAWFATDIEYEGWGGAEFSNPKGSLTLDLGSLGSLGWTDALCTLLSLAVLLLGTRAKGREVAPGA